MQTLGWVDYKVESSLQGYFFFHFFLNHLLLSDIQQVGRSFEWIPYYDNLWVNLRTECLVRGIPLKIKHTRRNIFILIPIIILLKRWGFSTHWLLILLGFLMKITERMRKPISFNLFRIMVIVNTNVSRLSQTCINVQRLEMSPQNWFSVFSFPLSKGPHTILLEFLRNKGSLPILVP